MSWIKSTNRELLIAGDRHRVSGDAAYRDDVLAMADWLNTEPKQLDVDTQLVDLGKHLVDDQELPLPPAILGRAGNDSSKKTVLIYGHFDVQPVCIPVSEPSDAHGDTFGRQISRTDGTPNPSHWLSTKRPGASSVEGAAMTKDPF